VQANTQSAIPFLVSTRGYGILWDNYSKTIFSDSSEGASLWSEVADDLDYYFILGDNIDGAIADTGSSREPPRCMADGPTATGKARNITRTARSCCA